MRVSLFVRLAVNLCVSLWLCESDHVGVSGCMCLCVSLTVCESLCVCLTMNLCVSL